MTSVDKKGTYWEFTFEPNYSILLVDLGLRVLFTIPIMLNYEQMTPLVNLILQILTTLFTLYISKRRKRSISSFLEMRLLSDQSDESENGTLENEKINFNKVELDLSSVPLKESGYFIFLIILIPVLSASSLFTQRNGFIEFFGYQYADTIALILLFICGGVLTLVYFRNKNLFISFKVRKVRRNRKKLSLTKKKELVDFLNRSLTIKDEVSLSEQNDFLIIELQTQIKIFRERLENLSLESIFLGALSFATLMQLIGPENIQGMSVIAELPGKDDFFSEIIEHLFTQPWFTREGIRLEAGLSIVTIGSLLASVFYIIVLIKRFSILKMIETAQLKIERANAWNIREETELENRFMRKAMRFTDQIQIELAYANQIARDIKSNLALTSYIRSLGIMSFFIVILVSADLIHHYLFVFASIFALYGTLASILMSSNLKYSSLFKSRRWASEQKFVSV